MIELPLSNSNQPAVVDDEFVDLLRYKWKLSKGYPCRKSQGFIWLHHVVIGKPPPGLVTDHINRNKLDARRENLRHVDVATNASNVNAQRRNLSGVRGCVWDKHAGKWKARVQSGGKTVSLGYFDRPEDAIPVLVAHRRLMFPLSCEGGGG